MEATGRVKHSSLVYYGVFYGRKNFYGTGPGQKWFLIGFERSCQFRERNINTFYTRNLHRAEVS